jgi:hypothetical protein
LGEQQVKAAYREQRRSCQIVFIAFSVRRFSLWAVVKIDLKEVGSFKKIEYRTDYSYLYSNLHHKNKQILLAMQL